MGVRSFRRPWPGWRQGWTTCLPRATKLPSSNSQLPSPLRFPLQTRPVLVRAPAPHPALRAQTRLSSRPFTVPSRSGSTRGANDRLQERLARAVAVKNAAAGQRPDRSPARSSAAGSPRQSLDVSNRQSSESADRLRDSSTAASPRGSQDVASRSSLDVALAANSEAPIPEPEQE